MDLLAQPIKEDLRISDTQLGFLTGMAFALLYATLGLPIARWADRGNRVTIASLAIGLWGITVMICLFVTSYLQLVVARMAAAVGESGCKPPTYSLLGDYFPGPAERIHAMSIYWAGGSLASLISAFAGGALNALFGWRVTFFLMGIPGLVLAVLVKLSLKEPRRHASRRDVQIARQPTLREALGTLWTSHSCRHLTLALTLLFTFVFCVSSWSAAFMIRSHGMGTAELGIWFGLIFGVGGSGSIFLGGYAAGRWFAHDVRMQMRLSAVAMALTVPFYVAFLLLTDRDLALLMQFPLMIAVNFCVAPTFALMQRLVPDSMRATSMAAVMLLYNLIGMGLGPQAVGLLSDALHPIAGGESLRYAMLTMSFVGLWSAYHFWHLSRRVEADLVAVDRIRRLAVEPHAIAVTSSAVQ